MSNGCLLRRVTVDDWESGKLEMALIEAGFQADKLSVWLLEVSTATHPQFHGDCMKIVIYKA